MRQIRKAAVIGAGVMGSGIAAHIANAGVPVVLLDVVPGAAKAAVERMLKTEPAAFMVPSAAKLVTAGDLESDASLISDCDWIVEAIVEDLSVKRELYGTVAPLLRDDAILSSNTSTIRLVDLTAGMPDARKRRFLITHFFNPPRYMRLLEIATAPATDADALASVSDFADRKLGKSIVHCKDRPGFIANRLGCFWMQSAILAAFDLGVSVEEADAVMAAFGIPKTGVFGLADLVGLDLMPKVNQSLAAALEKSDAFHGVNRPLPFVETMIAKGLIGRKGKGGFYRLNREQGKRKEAIDLATGAYRPAAAPRIADSATLLQENTRLGRYARAAMLKTLAYAVALVGDAADDGGSIDAAMRLGYNWKRGPFELIQRIGPSNFQRLLASEGLSTATIPAPRALVRAEGVVLLEDIKNGATPLLKNSSAALWDTGDGVACFELTGKMNTIDLAAMDLLDRSIDVVTRDHKALVIYSDAANFSAGVNLAQALFLINMADWKRIETLTSEGQRVFGRLKSAPFPSVGAACGLALGGGCELLLHCSAIQAHAESYIGLVETAVGIIPGWGGNKEMLLRGQGNGKLPRGPMPAIMKAFETISMAAVSKSAAQAREMMFLRSGDGITMNRDRLLADAKAKALALARDYKPPEAAVFSLPGESARVALSMAAQAVRRQGKATDHDMIVADALASVLSGGETSSPKSITGDQMLALERQQFLSLVRRPQTIARIEHMLETGKPLRN